MEFTFLGLNGSIQSKESGNTALLISTENVAVAIDCSVNLFRLVETPLLKALILTHEHIDHIYALPSLLHQLWLSGRGEKLTIYGEEETISIAEKLIDTFSIRNKKGIFEIATAIMPSQLKIDDLFIRRVANDHTSSSFGLELIDSKTSLLYTSDTRPLSDKLIKELKSSYDVVITEASGTDDELEALIYKGHQSGFRAALLGTILNAKEIYLVHLPPCTEKREAILLEAEGVNPRVRIGELLKSYRCY